jgi:hypothetical protein
MFVDEAYVGQSGRLVRTADNLARYEHNLVERLQQRSNGQIKPSFR